MTPHLDDLLARRARAVRILERLAERADRRHGRREVFVVRAYL
jgi:hypothetical protein